MPKTEEYVDMEFDVPADVAELAHEAKRRGI
jgi:hypothetical protein